jgi:hypothetical protein
MEKLILLIICFLSINNISSQVPVFNHTLKFAQRNDTIFRLLVYPSENEIDSLVVQNKYTKLSRTKWISDKYSDGSYYISKFRKKRTSEWLTKSVSRFSADFECEQKSFKLFHEDGTIEIYRRFGNLMFGGCVP